METDWVEGRLGIAGGGVQRLAECFSLHLDGLVADALVHRFEFASAMVLKAMRAYLDLSGLDGESPCTTIRQAAAEGLIPSRGEADEWMRMLHDRDLSRHTYDQALALQLCERISRTHAVLLRGMVETLTARLADG